MLVALLAAFGLSKLKRFGHTTRTAGARFGALDGLRGFLGTAVVFTHLRFFRNFALTGKGDPRLGSAYSLLGPIAVTLFFMITGFLFWNKVLLADGKIDAWSLYRGRFRRIAPAYALMAGAVLLLTFAATGFRAVIPKSDLIHQLIAVASVGIRSLPMVNGDPSGWWGGTVSWTLSYEWRFYLILPLIAGLANLQLKNAWLLLAPFAFFGFDPFYCIFAFGILGSYLVRMPRLRQILVGKLASVLVILVILNALFVVKQAYTPVADLLCFGIFLPIVCGNDLFGLLRLRASRHLGAISYSMYVLHCLTIYLVYRTLGLERAILSLGPIEYWLAVSAFLGGLVVLCTLTYHFVEWPFIKPRTSAVPGTKPTELRSMEPSGPSAEPSRLGTFG